MSTNQFTVAHAVRRQHHPFGVYVYRTHHRATLTRAITKAIQVRRSGYLAWVEQTGSRATR